MDWRLATLSGRKFGTSLSLAEIAIILTMTGKRGTVAKHVARIATLTAHIHLTSRVHWDLFDGYRIPLDTWTSAALAAHHVADITAPYELVLDVTMAGVARARCLVDAVTAMREHGHIGMFVSFERGEDFLHRTFVLVTPSIIVHVDSNGLVNDLMGREMIDAFQRMSKIPCKSMAGYGLQQTCRSDSCMLLSAYVWVQVAIAWQKQGNVGALQRLRDAYRRNNHPTVLRQIWLWALRVARYHELQTM